MAFALSLLQKLGLFAPKAKSDETFDLRLTRIRTREARRDSRAPVFVRSAL
jgi:hypothetical protein